MFEYLVRKNKTLNSSVDFGFIKRNRKSLEGRAWRQTLIIPAHRRLWQEDFCEFKA